MSEQDHHESIPKPIVGKKNQSTSVQGPSQQTLLSSTTATDNPLQALSKHAVTKGLSPESSTSSVKRQRLTKVAERALGLLPSLTMSPGTRSKDKENAEQQGGRQLRSSRQAKRPRSPSLKQSLRRGTRKRTRMQYRREELRKAKPNTVGAAVVAKYSDGQLLIGIDYGTTFTSVSYVKYSKDDECTAVYPADVSTISNWPEDNPNAHSLQVPTEIWYSSTPKTRRQDTGTVQPTPLVDGSDSSSDSSSDSESDSDCQVGLQNDSSSPSLAPRARRGKSPAIQPPHTNDDQGGDMWWGFQCPYQKFAAHSTRNPLNHIKRNKLALLDTDYTREGRDELVPVVETLLRNGTVRRHGGLKSNVQDLATDFFIPVLRHTEEQVRASGDYTANTEVRFALTVPVIFSQESRIVLQWALEEAVRTTGFGKLVGRGIDNLFMATEPKAAAAFLLGTSKDLTVCRKCFL
jgi:hypothetical protein